MAVIVLYAAGIHGALGRKGTSLDQLRTLREHARAVITAQGDLKGAVRKLDAEIRRRERSGGTGRGRRK
jgi:Domain of unknown function (DUF1843)